MYAYLRVLASQSKRTIFVGYADLDCVIVRVNASYCKVPIKNKLRTPTPMPLAAPLTLGYSPCAYLGFVNSILRSKNRRNIVKSVAICRIRHGWTENLVFCLLGFYFRFSLCFPSFLHIWAQFNDNPPPPLPFVELVRTLEYLWTYSPGLFFGLFGWIYKIHKAHIERKFFSSILGFIALIKVRPIFGSQKLIAAIVVSLWTKPVIALTNFDK